MDIVRRSSRPQVARYLWPIGGGVLLVALAAFSIPSLFHRSPALPTVDRSSLVLDVVARGTLVRSVHAAGRLVPDRVQVVATTTDGLVTDLPVRAGSRVGAGDVIAVLRNPDLDAAVVDARAQQAAADAELHSLREEASATRLNSQAAFATAGAELKRSDAEVNAYTALHASGLIGDLSYREAVIKSEENRGLVGIARRKIAVDGADADAKVAAGVAKVEQYAAQLTARQAQVATLVVRAGSAGIVQSLAVERGQRVTNGTELARIAQARDLKAVLQVAESDLRGVVPGMPVALQTNGDGMMAGRVTRIAPSAQNGTVAIDVALETVPAGVRPDQNIDGTIELSRAHNVLSLARPANAADNTAVAVYRLTAGDTRAVRTPVRFGTGSLDRIEITAGLHAGETVIISDTSTYDAPQLRIQQ